MAANANLVFGYVWLGAGPTTTVMNVTVLTPPTYIYSTAPNYPPPSPSTTAAQKLPRPGGLLLPLLLLLLAVAAAV